MSIWTRYFFKWIEIEKMLTGALTDSDRQMLQDLLQSLCFGCGTHHSTPPAGNGLCDACRMRRSWERN